MAPLVAVLGAIKNPRILLGALVLGLLVIIGLLWNQNTELNREVGRLQTGVATATLVNERTLGSLQTLKLANDMCNAQWDRVREHNETVVERFNASSNDLQEQHKRRLKELEKIFNETSCRTLGGISISTACPAAARGLRTSATRIDRTAD